MTPSTRTAIAALWLLAACGGGAPAPPPPPAAAPAAAPAPVVVSPLRAARVNGTTLAFRLAGDSGTPVVLVHGDLGDLRAWDSQIAAFARTHRVLVYSRRYHPPNPQLEDNQTYSPKLHAEDLAALLLSLDLAPAHVVGSSYGAYAALVLAMEHPQVVRSMVLAEPPIMPLLTRTPEGDAILKEFFATTLVPAKAAFARGDSIAGVRTFSDGASGAPGRFDRLPAAQRVAMLAHTFAMRRQVLANREEYFPPLRCPELGRIYTPALLVSGEASQRRFQVIMDELARCLASETSVRIPRAGHSMQTDQPTYFNQVVLRFLAAH